MKTQFCKLFLSLLLPSLAGCMGHVTTFTGADGTPWHSVKCNSRELCLSSAGKKCPSGYTVKDTNETTSYSSFNDPVFGVQTSETKTQTFTFACK